MIEIERIFRVPMYEVWKAWTDPSYIRQWFGSDPGGMVLGVVMDVRVGGSFEITFCNADRAEHTCSGVYSDVREFSRLSFSWTWRSEPGVESQVTVALARERDNTRMHFVHANVGAASAHNYSEGWKSTFEKLDRMLSSIHD